jgi:DNA-binding NarL/FixJ family response regulator
VIPLTEDKLYLREHVCANCPGSQWGKTTKCSIHNIHIGKVDSCPQWEQLESPKIKDHDGQLAYLSIEPAIEAVQKVQEDLRNYRWMVKRIENMRKELESAGNGLVSQYGLESSMPKAKGNISDPVHKEVQRRARDFQRLENLERKVANLEKYVAGLSDERDKEILACILDGWKYKDIAFHVGVSRETLDGLKKNLIKDMAWIFYEKEMTSRGAK